MFLVSCAFNPQVSSINHLCLYYHLQKKILRDIITTIKYGDTFWVAPLHFGAKQYFSKVCCEVPKYKRPFYEEDRGLMRCAEPLFFCCLVFYQN